MIEKLLIWALPVLLAALLSSIIMRKHKAKERFNLVGDALREAFKPELTILQTSEAFSITEIPDMLKSAFPKHQGAVNEFMFFLKGKQLDAFYKTWCEYYYDPNEETPQFIQYCDELDTDHQIAIRRIQAILEFTKN